MGTSTSANARRLEEPERPDPGVCRKCGGLVEPFLRPGFGSFPAKWLVCDLCHQCTLAKAKAAEDAEQEDRIRQLLRDSNLPAEAMHWDFESAQEQARKLKGPGDDFSLWQQAYQDCLYWPGGRQGLFLYGPSGLGKTVLAYCLLKKFTADNQAPGFFVSVTSLFVAASDSLAKDSPARDMEARAREAGLLVLDEVGAIRPRLKQRELLLGIVDYRVSEHKPTVYTSNYGPGELDKRLRDKFGRVIDRIVGSTKGVPFVGRSFRVLGAEESWQ